VGVLESNGEICGFFPFQRSAFGVGKPVGGILSDYQAVVSTPETPWDPCDILRGCGLVVWDFDHLIASQRQFTRFHQRRAISPCIDLAHGYQSYVAERRGAGSSQIAKTTAIMRKCERVVGDLRFDPDVRDPSLMSLLCKWKSDQYRRTGKRDLLAMSWVRELLGRILAMKSPAFAGILSVLWAGEKPIAAHFGMRSRNVWHYWFPAYEPEFGKYSPGLMLLLKMAEAAPSMGIRTIDLGKGESLYKQRLMNSAVELAEGSIERPSIAAATRLLWRFSRRIIHGSPLIYPARTVRSMGRNIRDVLQR
jgi:CelD/BcsL family acetyltransferase involved in cellulose biosynthesis